MADNSTNAVLREEQPGEPGQPLDGERARRAPIQRDARRDLLDEIVVDFGPRDLFTAYFALADRACRERGVELSFASFEELKAANIANRDTWLPIFPVFDPAYGVSEEAGFCILGRNADGVVVATQAARLYRLLDEDFHDAAESLRFFYSDPEARRRAGETCKVTAPSARTIQGRVVFSGGGWYHPNYRKRGLFELIPRISRALAFTRWQTDVTMTMMAEKVVAGGRAAAAGYPSVDWDVSMRNSPLGDIRLAVLTMRTPYMLDDIALAAERLRPQIDALVQNRA